MNCTQCNDELETVKIIDEGYKHVFINDPGGDGGLKSTDR